MFLEILALSIIVESLTFEGLGSLPGNEGSSTAQSISADGQIIVGFSSSARASAGPLKGFLNAKEAFIWTQDVGMKGLGFLSNPKGIRHSFATKISADGRTIVGGSISTESLKGKTPGAEGFYWTEKKGLVGIGVPENLIKRESSAFGVSKSGDWIGGWFQDDQGMQGYVWNEVHGLKGVGSLSGFHFGKIIEISTASRQALGNDQIFISKSRRSCLSPFFYALDSEMREPLQDNLCAAAHGMSPDEALVYGTAPVDSFNTHGFIYNREKRTFEMFRPLPGHQRAIIKAVDPLRRLAFGRSERLEDPKNLTAVVWEDSSNGLLLKDWLGRKGLRLREEWQFNDIVGISEDGCFLVGNGLNSRNDPEGFRISVCDVPPQQRAPK